MDRNNTFIRNKLLDAFIPTLSFQDQTSPFQPKNHSRNNIAPKASSITRQSYINLEEKLQEDSLIVPQPPQHMFSTQFSLAQSAMSKAQSLISSQRRSNRKYLKVVSNPHQDISRNSPKQSSRKSNMRESSLFQSKKIPHNWLFIEPNQQKGKRCQSHHQSCKNIQYSNNAINNTIAVEMGSKCVQSQSVNMDSSKINSLEQLISSQPSRMNETFCRPNAEVQTVSSTIALKQGKPPNLINAPTASLHPKIDQSNILRVVLGKVQPVYRTIVRKDINPNVNRTHSQNNLNLTAARRPPQFVNANNGQKHLILHPQQQRYSNCLGKQNYMVMADTANLRNQIVQQVLR